MSDTAPTSAPAKKVPAKKNAAPAPAKKAAAPAAKKPAVKAASAPKPPSLADGPYPWMLNRIRSTFVKNLAEDKRTEARVALKQVTTFPEFIDAAKPFGFKETGPALIIFFQQLVEEGVTVRGGAKE